MVEKVGYTRPINAPRPVRRAGSVSGPDFAEALARAEGVLGVSGTEAVGSVGAVGSAGGLVGLQEVDEREAKRRRAVRRGRLTLDALAGLRDALLMGTLPLTTIEKLEKLVAEERAITTDPALAAILDEIEVRAAVEIAKLEMAGVLPPRD